MLETMLGGLIMCVGAAGAVQFINWLFNPRASAAVCMPGGGICKPLTAGQHSQNDWVRNYDNDGQPAIVDAVSTQAADIARGDVYFPGRYQAVPMDAPYPPEWAAGEEAPQGIPVPNWPAKVDR